MLFDGFQNAVRTPRARFYDRCKQAVPQCTQTCNSSTQACTCTDTDTWQDAHAHMQLHRRHMDTSRRHLDDLEGVHIHASVYKSVQKCINTYKHTQIDTKHTQNTHAHAHVHMITCDTFQHAQTAPRRPSKLIIACTHTSPRRPRTPYAMYRTHAYARKRTSRLAHAT